LVAVSRNEVFVEHTLEGLPPEGFIQTAGGWFTVTVTFTRLLSQPVDGSYVVTQKEVVSLKVAVYVVIVTGPPPV
jgi:hypothetical protein